MANYNEIYKSQMDWQNVFVRTGNFPLDRSSIFGSYEDALKYAQGDGSDLRGLGKTSYVGQIIAVYEDDVVSVYKISGKDIMNPEDKSIVIKERGLEELISRGDVHKLIADAILSDDFEVQTKKIISATSINSDLIYNFEETTKDIIANENIISNKVITDDKITIIGTPLAQIINPNNDLNVTIDSSTDLQTVLKLLLDKELYPSNIKFIEGTVTNTTDKPSVSANIVEGATVEVGTHCTFNRITVPNVAIVTTNRKLENIEYGYSLSNNNTKECADTEIITHPSDKYINQGTHKLSITYTGFDNVTNKVKTAMTRDECYVDFNAAYVKEGGNSLTVSYEAPVVSAKFNAIPTIYPCSNKQNTSSKVVIEEYPSYIASANTTCRSIRTYTVKGAWYLYAGGANSNFDFTISSVRNLDKINLISNGSATISSTSSCEKVVIAFPSKWGYLKEVRDNGSNTIITNNFDEIETVDVKGANNYGSCNYKVHVYTPNNRLNNGFNYTITIG